MVSYPLRPLDNRQKTAKTLARQHGVVMIPGQDPSQWPRLDGKEHFDQVHPVHAQAAEALSGLLARAANPVHGPGLLAPAQPQPPMQGLLAVGPAGASAPAPATKRRAVKSAPKKVASKPGKRAVVKKPKASARRGRGK